MPWVGPFLAPLPRRVSVFSVPCLDQRRFKAHQDAAAITRIVEMLEEWLKETFQWGRHDVNLVSGETAAAGADLLAVVDHLQEIAEHRESSGLDIEGWRLADKAAGWADEFARSMVEATTTPDTET